MRQAEKLLTERAENLWEGPDDRAIEHHLMEGRSVAVKLEDGSLITGEINILSEPARDYDGLYNKHEEDRGTYHKRISDIFTKGKNPFVVVVNAQMGNEAVGVLILNKKKILWVVPKD
jgi:hypothetical protein